LFRRSDRRDDGPDERALAARNAATQGFLALDDEQQAAAAAVHAAEQLGAGQPGSPQRLADAWAQVASVGDAATEAYLTASRDFPLDGTGPVRGAKEADERALREVERARESIRRFRSTHARALDEAEFALRALPGAVQEARTALMSARAAVAQADAAGVGSRRAAERLAEADRAAALIDSGGLHERRQAAQHVLELARSAASLAAEAPRTAQHVRSAFASVTTRRAAALTKIERIEPAMSGLRREFSEPCSRDLVDAEPRARAAVAEADAAIATARRHADAGDWDDAGDAVAAARAALGRAEERHDAVTDRLTGLRAVRQDPAKRAADTRFVLRDAQRLVVDRGLVKEFGPVLDAQSVRLENARARLAEGVHPDYWFYLTELRGIEERVRDVVSRVRGTHAR
jgi:hypothetical protein